MVQGGLLCGDAREKRYIIDYMTQLQTGEIAKGKPLSDKFVNIAGDIIQDLRGIYQELNKEVNQGDRWN